MAKYPKRQKVKRYRRSFYSREMRVKKGIGIAVLVLVVLAAAWVAAPHVLDWATHTWYTVVRNRDLSASSPAGGSASSAAESTASSVAEEPAASSEAQPEVVTPAVDGTAIVEGAWAEADLTTLTDDAAIRAAAQQRAFDDVADHFARNTGVAAHDDFEPFPGCGFGDETHVSGGEFNDIERGEVLRRRAADRSPDAGNGFDESHVANISFLVVRRAGYNIFMENLSWRIF